MTPAVRAALAALAILAGTGCASAGPSPDPAPESAGDAQEMAELENAFWYCDYVATTQGVLAAPMAACQHATRELKERKFGGSFRALTDWWRENKGAEHERLGRASAGVR